MRLQSFSRLSSLSTDGLQRVVKPEGTAMSATDCSTSQSGDSNGVSVSTTKRPLHRLGVVRRLQNVSQRTVARHLGTEIATVRQQERATSDLSLSQLYEWQEVLEVPVSELLVEDHDPLSSPVMKRAQLVRIMKTALAILEAAEQKPVQRMAQTMVDQLVDLMPELEDVGPWHTVGKRRRHDELGIAAERSLSEDVFLELLD